MQPPTTQALLKQQCHLIDFDGMSAIVGVSSAKLEKMTQQKIPNIEAAFAKVCQQKVRVQIEVASAKKNSENNSTATIGKAIATTPFAPPPPAPSPTPVAVSEAVQRRESAPVSVATRARETCVANYSSSN